MNDTTTRHPGDAEYLAAITGMHEHTPSPRPEPATGDFVSGETAGRRWSGRVERIENGRMTLDVGGAWIAVPVTDITH